jgi:hypothetical protein
MKRLFVAAVPAGCLVSLLIAPPSFAQAPADPGAAPASLPPSTAVTPGTTVVAPATPAPGVTLVQRTDPADTGTAVVEKDKKTEKTDTTRQLEDGGLGLEWVYLNADLGAAYTDLASLKASNWALQDNASSGPAFGLAAGVRLVFLSLGVRVRDLALSSYNIWETDLEALFHFRIWRIDGYFGGRGGYAFLGAFSADSLRTSTGSAASDVTVHGWNVGPTFGLDFYITKLISVGVDANVEAMFLERPPLPLPAGQTVAPQYASLYNASGSSVGVGFIGMSHLGVHF